MANTVTITITVAQAASAELDATSAATIAQEAKEHVLRSLASKGYTATASATSA
jgi:hypothetical protein